MTTRALYLVEGPDLRYPSISSLYFSTDEEAAEYYRKTLPVPVEVTRLPETERNFSK